ncbi:hypothetical protein HNQ78_002450 [Phycisphaera mikurensis]|nr:hypothetical protein [Phycisphaera mikurensis]
MRPHAPPAAPGRLDPGAPRPHRTEPGSGRRIAATAEAAGGADPGGVGCSRVLRRRAREATRGRRSDARPGWALPPLAPDRAHLLLGPGRQAGRTDGRGHRQSSGLLARGMRSSRGFRPGGRGRPRSAGRAATQRRVFGRFEHELLPSPCPRPRAAAAPTPRGHAAVAGCEAFGGPASAEAQRKPKTPDPAQGAEPRLCLSGPPPRLCRGQGIRRPPSRRIRRSLRRRRTHSGSSGGVRARCGHRRSSKRPGRAGRDSRGPKPIQPATADGPRQRRQRWFLHRQPQRTT